MKKYSTQLLALASIVIGTSSVAQAGTMDIDKVLGELTHQHNNTSSLVKSTRQPTSLAFSSALVSQPTTKAKKDTNVLGQLTAVASNTVSKFKQSGVASWYGRQFHGRKTASGETFDMNAMTAAHSTLPMNCYIKVTNKTNGKSVIVRVNDRPTQKGKVLDLSYGAAQMIGLTQKGNVNIERVDNP